MVPGKQAKAIKSNGFGGREIEFSVLRCAIMLVFALLVSFSVPSFGADTEKTVAQIVEEQGKAVVLVSNVGPLGIVQGIGSGFFVRSNGVFVTNYHVVERARAIKVKLADGRKVDAAGTIELAPESDLAILKVNGDKFPTVTLGNSDGVEVGEHVVAMGSPMGLENTVTDGLLSGIRRGEDKPTETKHEKVFQISTPISLGSIGGPVFNMRGEVIGIAYAGIFLIAQNLNFTIPINDAKPLIRDRSCPDHRGFRVHSSTTRLASHRQPAKLYLSRAWRAVL